MKRQSTKHIVVHCSATYADQNITAATIDEWHKARGWSGIGYHLVICRDGTIEAGRPLDDVGAHVKGRNTVSVGICLIGGLDNNGDAQNNFTPEQFSALFSTTTFLQQMYPNAEILGHRDLSPDLNGDGIIDKWEWTKECPCFDVKPFFQGREVA